MNLMEELQKAAARGVEVTVITNGGKVPELRLRWRFWNTNDSGFGKFRAAGYELFVRDCDGDGSYWELRRGDNRRQVISKGDIREWKPHYHFDACCLAAEGALFTEVDRRLAVLRRRRRRRDIARSRA